MWNHVGMSDLESMTKEELLEQARELDIPGRSGMDKETLAKAVADFRGAADIPPPFAPEGNVIVRGAGGTVHPVESANIESQRSAAPAIAAQLGRDPQPTPVQPDPA